MMDSSATMLSPAPSRGPCKRLDPSFWEHDWYILKSLRSCIESIVTWERLRDDARVVVDMGCGYSPYEPLFRQPNCRYLRGDLQGDVDFLIEPGRPADLPDGSLLRPIAYHHLCPVAHMVNGGPDRKPLACAIHAW